MHAVFPSTEVWKKIPVDKRKAYMYEWEPRRLKSKSGMPMPFKRSCGYRRMLVSGGKLLRVDNESNKNHLAVVRQAPSILSDGWIVEEVPRTCMGFADKICGYRRMLVSGGKLLRVDNESNKNHLAVVQEAPPILSDGWIVEEVPRSYMGFADKYYYEPESGLKFRSLVSIERYLEDLNDNAPLSRTLEEIMENRSLARAFKLENHKSSAQSNKKLSREKAQASSFLDPPLKVSWAIASAQGDSWNPFIAEVSIPDSVKQKWTNRFMLFMKEGTRNFQNSPA